MYPCFGSRQPVSLAIISMDHGRTMLSKPISELSAPSHIVDILFNINKNHHHKFKSYYYTILYLLAHW